MHKRHEVLFQQLRTYRSGVLQAVSTLTAEEAEQIPAGFHNNIRWNLGHIYLDQYLWIQALTKEPAPVPPDFHNFFGFGTSPECFTAGTPSFTELQELLHRQPADIEGRYADKLDQEFPPTEMGMHTVEQVLIRTIFHEGMHLQAILDLKKCIQHSSVR